MSKTAIVTARVDPDLKTQTEQVLKALGLTPSQAITLFYAQVKLQQGLPFAVHIPNAETRQALADAHNGQGVEKFETPEKLFEDLDI